MAEARRGRGRHRRAAAVLVAVGLAAATGVVATAAPAAAACPSGGLVPILREVAVSQGVGTYAPLARGKETLVRIYLGLPQCADPANAIEVRGGSLTVAVPGGSTITVPPARVPVSPYDQVTPFGSASPADDPADLVFAVPGDALESTAGGDVTATLSATVEFASRLTKNGAWTPGQATYASVGGNPVTATLAPRANALRYLVVPIVDRSIGLGTTWPTAGPQAVVRGMLAASRMLPVRDGVHASLDPGQPATDAGLRYELLQAELGIDAGPGGLNLVSGGKLCVTSLGFRALAPELATRLQSWNVENPDAQADRVVGVAWQGFANGSANGCVEGISRVPSAELFVRAVADTTNVPSTTGALIVHETFHSVGGATGTGTDGGFHSTATQADTTTPNRTFNVSTRAVLGGANRTAMRLSSGWNEQTTLLERAHYELARCLLTPIAGVACESQPSGSIGTALAGPAWVLYGSTDGTPAGTSILNSYTDAFVTRTPPSPASSFAVVQRDAAGAVVASQPVPTSTSVPDDDDTPGPATTDPVRIIDVAVELHPDAVVFELRNGSTPLYTRLLDAPPVLGSVRNPVIVTGAVNRTNAAGADTQPALSPDASRLAWTTAGGVRVQVPGKAPSVALAGASQPALSADGRVAYVTSEGAVAVAAVASQGNTTTVGTPATVYNGSLLGLSLFAQPASHPSWTPDGDLVVSIGGDLWRLDVPAPGIVPPDPVVCAIPLVSMLAARCTQLTATAAAETWPSVAPDGRIVFQLGADQVARVAADGSGQTVLVSDATSPSASSTLLAFVRGGSTWVLDGTEQQLLAPGDGAPSLSADGGAVAVERAVAGAPDVFLLTLGRGPLTLSASDEFPALLVLDVLVDCGGQWVLVDGNLRPDAVVGGQASWIYTPPAGLPCDGELMYRVSDGVTAVRTTTPGSTGRNTPPSVAIQWLPTIFEGDAIPVAADSYDLEDGDLTVTYRLVGPGTDRIVTAAELPDIQPPEGGWTPGQWELRAAVTDSGGLTATDVRAFTIRSDEDHDHVETRFDVRCSNDSADQDPASGDEDDDGDGVPNRDDPAPCLPTMNATVELSPTVLQLDSLGPPLLAKVATSACNLRQVRAPDVTIVQIGGLRVPTPIPASTWSGRSSSEGQAQFPRQAVIDFIRSAGLDGDPDAVPLVVRVAAGNCVAHGFDPHSPRLNP